MFITPTRYHKGRKVFSVTSREFSVILTGPPQFIYSVVPLIVLISPVFIEKRMLTTGRKARMMYGYQYVADTVFLPSVIWKFS